MPHRHCTHAKHMNACCKTHEACKLQTSLMHACHTHMHSIHTLYASCEHMTFTLCASHTHAACTPHARMPQAHSMCPTCKPCRAHAHHFTFHTHAAPAHTLHAHPKHNINMSQSCLMNAAIVPYTVLASRMPYVGCTFSTFTH